MRRSLRRLAQGGQHLGLVLVARLGLGQGGVASGAFDGSGTFVAKQVLAKHDERYMPREVSKALKEQGEWRGDGAPPPSYRAMKDQSGT